MTDTKKFEKILSENDHINPLSSNTGTRNYYNYDVEDVVRTNVLGTTKILKLCKKYKYKKVIVPTTQM